MRSTGLLAAIFCVALLLTACGDNGDEGASPTVTSVPAAPTLPPIATRAPGPSPTPVAAHPAGTRTGVESIDRVLAAVEDGSAASLESALSYQERRCDNRDAVGSNPCPPGVEEGTPVDVVSSATCEGEFLTRDSEALQEALADFLRPADSTRLLSPRLYAVVEVEPGRVVSPLPYHYLVIFVTGHTLLLDDGGITHLGFPCGGVGAADLFHPADEVILAPPER